MKDLKNLFETAKLKQYAEQSELLMLERFSEMEDYRIVLMCTADSYKIAIKYLKDRKKPMPDIIVNIDSKIKIENTADIPIVDLLDFMKIAIEEKESYCLLAASEFYSYHKSVKNKINEYLKPVNVNKVIDIFPMLDLNYKILWWNEITKYKDDFINGVSIYDDCLSKDTYYEYLKSYLIGQPYCGETFPETEKYFDKDIFKLKDDEVWVNFGSGIGDTIFIFLNKKQCFKKIYAIEADSNTAQELAYNLSFYDESVTSKMEVINNFIGNGKKEIPFEECIDESSSLINMDIEGAELNVIESAKDVIKRDRPVLAICVYHKWDDLITIPKKIMSIVSDYKYYLRKYPSVQSRSGFYDSRYQVNELVMYAVPAERAI